MGLLEFWEDTGQRRRDVQPPGAELGMGALGVPKLMSDTNLRIQKAETTPGRINADKTTSRCISFKGQKI